MSTAQMAFDTHKPTINAIEDDRITSPRMSTADTIGEAEELAKIVQQDREKLLASGLDPIYVDTLHERIGAYAVAEAEYETIAFAKSDARKAWEKLEPDAKELRRRLVHCLRFCFKRNNMPDEATRVSEIARGNGRRDLTIDMMDLHKMVEKYMHLLAAIGVEETVVQEAAEMFEKLRNLLGDIDTTPQEVAEKKLLAKKAYTYLWQAVDAIREHGQFVFWQEAQKLDSYRSDHYQAMGKLSHISQNN